MTSHAVEIEWGQKNQHFQKYSGAWFYGAVYKGSKGSWYWTFFSNDVIANTGLNPSSSEQEAKDQIIAFISEQSQS